MRIQSYFRIVLLLVAVTVGLAQPASAGPFAAGKCKPGKIVLPGGKFFKPPAEKMLKPAKLQLAKPDKKVEKMLKPAKVKLAKPDKKVEKMLKPAKVEFKEVVKPKPHKMHKPPKRKHGPAH